MSLILNNNFELLKQLFTDCLNAKNNTKEAKIDTDEKLKIGSMEFVLIKKINRLVKYKVRSGREELQAQKTLVDCNRLHLQNLLYEVNYLKREIKHCYKFKSQDEDIDIYEPKDESVCESALSHKDRIERLERELNLRKKLSEDCNKLLCDKNTIFNQIVVKMETLSTFAPSLRTLLKATRPLQEALQMPIEQKWKLEQKVHMLPHKLYLPYVNLKTVEQLESGFELVVIGNEDEMKMNEIKRNQMDVTPDLYSLLNSHPLSLQLKFTDPQFVSDFITVRIYYLPALDIATGLCEINLSENQISHSESNILQDFLKYIGENDTGESMPFSCASLSLENHNIFLNEFHKTLVKHNLGKPYRWIQHLCGNSSFNYAKIDHHNILHLKEFTSDCVKKIKNYWHSRLIIISQIRSFMNKNLEEYLDNQIGCSKPNCALVQWAAITWEEYESCETTRQLVNHNLTDNTCSNYRAVIVLGSAKMECLISISNKYPMNAPLWTITVHWNGHHNALNNSSIKIMELYTNSISDSKCQFSNILAKQLLRTMYSFDIFLETEGPLYQPLEYTKEKSFIKSFSKRLRVRPYKKITKDSSIKNTYRCVPSNKIFIQDYSGQHSYSVLHWNSKRLSRHISNICGGRSSSTIGIFCSNNILTILIIRTCWMSGQKIILLNRGLSLQQLRSLAKETKVRLLISSDNDIPLIRLDSKFLCNDFKNEVLSNIDILNTVYGHIVTKPILITHEELYSKIGKALQLSPLTKSDKIFQLNIFDPFDSKGAWQTILGINIPSKNRVNVLIAEPKVYQKLIEEYENMYAEDKSGRTYKGIHLQETQYSINTNRKIEDNNVLPNAKNILLNLKRIANGTYPILHVAVIGRLAMLNQDYLFSHTGEIESYSNGFLKTISRYYRHFSC